MNKIALRINPQKDGDLSLAKKVLSVLKTFCEKIYIEKEYAASFSGVEAYTDDDFPKDAELLLVLGGDGTMLHTAQLALVHDLPMLGINMGRVGYLASLECEELDLLTALAEDGFVEKKHMILQVEKMGDSGLTLLGYALNDVVFDGKGHLADIRLYDGDNFIDYRADGLIAATPTGSTAYSFSAGGPVMDEGMDAICVTPVCPRSFFSRSLLFSPESVLRVVNIGVRNGDLAVSIDGHIHLSFANGESVMVRRAPKCVRILSLKERHLLEVLCTKMGAKYF